MATSYSSQSQSQQKEPGKHHHERLPIKDSIKAKREAYCQQIKSKSGDLQKLEENRNGLIVVYEHKKCRFVKTEKNYRILRNLELSVGIELIKAADNISTNITTYTGFNTSLVKALNDLVQSAKSAQAKFGDLRVSAETLAAATKNSCNRTQMTLLTGEIHEDCKEGPLPGKRPDDCRDAGRVLEELIAKPAHLCMDIDAVLSTAVDVLGIQTFSNINSLSQTFLPSIKTSAKTFDDFINDRIKASTTELTTAQTALSDSAKAVIDVEYQVFNSRIDLEVDNGVKEFLCHPPCDCITEGEGSFKDCKCKICDISRDVAFIYKRETKEQQPQP
ncbi:MAG TPA: hypothetical protein VGI82_03165 [Chitinophagaceae bacterium]|jgi:hypothetical protein